MINFSWFQKKIGHFFISLEKRNRYNYWVKKGKPTVIVYDNFKCESIYSKYYENPPDNYTGKIISNGVISYWVNGKKHRTNGPAMIFPVENICYPNGAVSFCLNDCHYSKEDWFQQLSEEEKFQALFNIDEG